MSCGLRIQIWKICDAEWNSEDAVEELLRYYSDDSGTEPYIVAEMKEK